MKKTLNLFSGIASVFALFAVLIACSAPKAEAASANVSTEIPDALRLHILANSDSDEDQRVKLLVKRFIKERQALPVLFVWSCREATERESFIFVWRLVKTNRKGENHGIQNCPCGQPQQRQDDAL